MKIGRVTKLFNVIGITFFIILITIIFYLGVDRYFHRHSVYIPKDLEECFVELKEALTESQFEEFKNISEGEIIKKCHLGLGMWIRNHWGLWEKSRLAKYFNKMGIFHPDDISGIVLISFHRHLNEKDLKVKEQVRIYQKYWELLKKFTRQKDMGSRLQF